jgi:Trypsin-co-occurring domain 2
MATIPIANAIQSLRQEIIAAMQQAQDEDMKFELGDIELEFQVQITQQKGDEINAKGGFSFGLVSAEASGKESEQRSKASTHRVKLTLKPKKADGSSLDVSAQGVTELPG